jgi:hypothetical protein
MPIEFRFDDLDLSEEPESGMSEKLDTYTFTYCTGGCPES